MMENETSASVEAATSDSPGSTTGEEKANQSFSQSHSHKDPTSVNIDQWFISEGVAGEGPKPEWLNTNNHPSMAHQAEHAYQNWQNTNSELSKAQDKIKGFETRSDAFSGAPDTYEISLSEANVAAGFNLNKEDPALIRVMDMGKSNHVSADFMNNLVNEHIQATNEADNIAIKAYEDHQQAEYNSLSDPAKDQLKQAQQALRNRLSDSEFSALEKGHLTADYWRALTKIGSNSNLANVPTQLPEMAKPDIRNDLRRQLKEAFIDNRGGRNQAEVIKQYQAAMDQGVFK
jgi:hypothetical protein